LELLDLLAQNKKKGSSIDDLASFEALGVIKLLASENDLAVKATQHALHTKKQKT
jgi:hypothetical protein